MSKEIVFVTVALCVTALAWGFISMPRSYNDCIEQNIGNAHSDTAARVVVSMCSQKFKNTYTDQEVFGVK